MHDARFMIHDLSCILHIFIHVHMCQLASPKCPTTTRIFVIELQRTLSGMTLKLYYLQSSIFLLEE